MRRQKQCTWVHPLKPERDSKKTLSTEEEEIPSIKDEEIFTERSQEIYLQIQDMEVDQDLTTIVLEGKIIKPKVINPDHRMILGHPRFLNALHINVKLAL